MALVQALLVRALGRPLLAPSPTAGPLVRWGTELHDRFLLPFYVAADIAEVVDDLVRHGFAFDARVAGAVPRVPLPAHRRGRRRRRAPRAAAAPSSRGRCSARRSRRPAPRATSTRRSSGCRCRSTGSPPTRHVVTCNGVPVPLHPTGRAGAYVAGRALPGLEAAVGAAPDDRGPRPARVRPRRPLERPLARRLHLPRDATRAGGPTTGSRSTPTRPRPAGPAGSPPTATRRARSTSTPCSPRGRRVGRSARRPWSTLGRSICGAHRSPGRG